MAPDVIVTAAVKRVMTALALAWSFGCAAHTSLAPVGAGRLVPNLGLGGPIVAAFGTHVPIPYVTAGADYGLGPRLNFTGDLHLLPLAYQVVGLDAGVTWFPLAASGGRPTVGIQPRVFAFASIKSGVSRRALFYPVTSISAAWLGSGLYVGSDIAGPLPKPDYDAEAPSFLVSPFVGRRWKVGGFFLVTEVKWQAANVRSDQMAIEYIHVGGHGGLTPLISLQRGF